MTTPSIHPVVHPVVPLRAACHAAAMAVALCIASSAAAQSRRVFVNGERLSDARVEALARMNCSDIPDGAYWLNTRTGAWGYAGNRQVQGVLGDGCRSAGGNGGGEGRYGPYATMRRAEEIVNQFRSQGYRAVAFHNGDGYYVNVKR